MKVKKISLAVIAAAVSLTLAIPAAHASNIMSVDGTSSPATDVTSVGLFSGTMVFDTDYNVPNRCTTAAISGYIKRGASVTAGNQIGGITAARFGLPCTFTSLLYPGTVQKVGATEWGIFVRATPAKGQAAVRVEMRAVNLRMRSTGTAPYACEFGATGTVIGTLNQSTQELTFNSPATYPLALLAYNGTGTSTPASPGVGTCGGQIYTGDTARMTGVFTVTTLGLGGFNF